VVRARQRQHRVPGSEGRTLKVIDDGEYYSYDESGLHSYNPADPAYGGKYTLHTLDLLKYDIDAEKGTLMSVSNRNGRTVFFKENSIESNTGRKIAITRDPQGRIIKITDPRGVAGEPGRHHVEHPQAARRIGLPSGCPRSPPLARRCSNHVDAARVLALPHLTGD
jgi:YD repeat-containing protein